MPALSDRYESLDYDLNENELQKQMDKSQGIASYDGAHKHIARLNFYFHDNEAFQLSLWRMALNRWVVCFFIGASTAVIAVGIHAFVFHVSFVKFLCVRSSLFFFIYFQFLPQITFLISDGSASRQRPVPTVARVGWLELCFGVDRSIDGALRFRCKFFRLFGVSSRPVAAGSGIPQVKCFLNGVQIPGVIRLKTLVAKVVGVACSVAGGLAVGKEGPMIHSGAVLAAGISQGRCVTIPMDFHVFDYFRTDREKRDFVCAGAASGVAAALEEGASFWNQSLTWRIFFASMISSFVLNFLLSAFYGKPGAISWRGLANFGFFGEINYSILELGIFIAIGAIGGLSGALFNHISYKLTIFRMQYMRRAWQKVFDAMLIASVSALVGFGAIFLIDDCQPLKFDHNSSVLWCADGYYSAVAELYFQTPEETVKALFQNSAEYVSSLTLFVYALAYYLLAVWTYGISVPSGIFIPSLLIGAAWGRLIGLGLQASHPYFIVIDVHKFALVGAAAQLGGIVRMTISLCAIIVEATRNISFGLPIMLTLMTAKWVGDYFNEGIYSMHIQLAEVPILDWDPPQLASCIPAIQVMCPCVTVFREIENVGRIYQTLLQERHHGYPVVDSFDPDDEMRPEGTFGRLKGLVLRYQLITLLQNKLIDYFPQIFWFDPMAQKRAFEKRIL
ncbi:unnamed protein product [Soboliphyme baturini]|uniref:Chloride channel protein n=1 Tax=Soboliphyme baturini TaxID=241478 RepID=A0A183IDK9_9BILA|nr:unnamed protein product [Soboliphyme baturini]